MAATVSVSVLMSVNDDSGAAGGLLIGVHVLSIENIEDDAVEVSVQQLIDCSGNQSTSVESMIL
ncbi:MAG: hypothetical protein M1830_010209, partial [Pleopsidium flavum]